MEVKKGYHLSEIGVIPNDWKVSLLDSFATITRLAGAEYSSVWKETSDGEIIALRGFNIGQNKIIERDIARISNQLSLKLKRSRLRKGDVIYPCVGTIGNAAVIEEDDKYHIQQNIARIIPDKKSVSPYYLAHYLMSHLGLVEVMKFNATSSQPNVLVGSLRQYSIALPKSIEEQTAIATALSDADAFISGLEKLIAKKRNIKQGAMQKLLQRKDSWEVKKLGEIGECIIGLTYKPENIKEDGLLVLRSSNVQNGVLAYDDNVYVDVRVPEKLIVKQSDILVCVRNGSRDLIGKCALIEGRAIGESFGAFMSVFRSAYNKFVFCVFQSSIFKRQIDEHLGATINQITNKSMNSFEIPFPTIEEQNEIVEILSDMDKEIVSLENKLSKYRQVKQGMMQNLLTGKIRLL